MEFNFLDWTESVTGEEQNTSGTLIRWLRACGFYLIHVVIAGVAVFLVSIFLAAGVEPLNSNAGNFLFWAPIFPGEIILGFLAGFAVNKFLRSGSAKWVWILPALWLLSDVPSSIRSTGWSYTLSYLFGGKCSDCVEVALLVAPFYASIAYSLGAWAALKRAIAGRDEENLGTGGVLLMIGLYSVAVVIGVYVVTFVFVLSTMLISHPAGRLARIAFGGPYYGGEVVVALVGGSLFGSRIKAQWAKWAWLLPSIWLLVYMAYTADHAGQMSAVQYVWTHFFTGSCAKPNIGCPQETFGTCPFLSSLAYSLGAWITSRMRTSRANLQSNPKLVT